jgi:FkbM family methyltransferase
LYGLTKIVQGLQASVDPTHILRRRRMLRFYSQFLGEGDLCFDIGANLGNRTDIFWKLGANVIAVEPQDNCVHELCRRYMNKDRITIVQKAVGDKEGKAEMFICNAHALTSLSKEWITAVRRKRFSNCNWDKTVEVDVTTLDALVSEYGKPAFCKIDVEGFEFEVLKGLHKPVGTISFEFVPEYLDSAINSIEYLSCIGKTRFNYSIGESMRVALPKWVKPDEICKILVSLPDKSIFGDVYAKFA